MLKKIIGTTGTRILNAVFNLIILVLITNKIGNEGLGIIGLILVDITIIQLSVDLVAGSSLVYFASRANLGQLLFPALFFVDSSRETFLKAHLYGAQINAEHVEKMLVELFK